mmetsp:Transcript_9379/g.21222  ORF Transcript_9379/g.21222 Transcript_9379/m.21222 type:complete len:213 (+) Transcript_9379:1249-1887(+)
MPTAAYSPALGVPGGQERGPPGGRRCRSSAGSTSTTLAAAAASAAACFSALPPLAAPGLAGLLAVEEGEEPLLPQSHSASGPALAAGGPRRPYGASRANRSSAELTGLFSACSSSFLPSASASISSHRAPPPCPALPSGGRRRDGGDGGGAPANGITPPISCAAEASASSLASGGEVEPTCRSKATVTGRGRSRRSAKTSSVEAPGASAGGR